MKLKQSTPSKNEAFRFSVYREGNPVFEKIHGKYFPSSFDKYITVCADSSYSLLEDVLEIIIPTLYINNIGVIVFSIHENAKFNNCQNINKIHLRHAAFLLDKSELHVCGQDWSLALSQNNNSKRMLIGDIDKRSLFQNDASVEGSLTNPENVIKEIFSNLNIDQDIEIDTKFIAPAYGVKLIEIIPDFDLEHPPNIDRGSLVGIRCDLCENWEFVAKMISFGFSPSVTCVSPPKKPIIGFLSGVSYINIIINKDTSPQEILDIESCGIPYKLLSREENPLEEKRIFFDFPNIYFVDNWGKKNLDKLKDLPYDTKLRSKRTLVSKDGTFLSAFHWKLNLPVSNREGNLLLDGLEDETFLEEAELFYYYK
jgi:hypothetical protein